MKLVPNNQKDCLFQSIKDLPLTDDFKSVACNLNIKTLDEMLQVKVKLLLEKPGFTYHLLQELIQFLEEKGLANLLKE